MKFPASSNSSTGGAAIAFWSARTVLGRCRIQAWPWLSIETLDTWPQTYLLGSLGHDGSGSNIGTSRVCGAGVCAARRPLNAAWPSATTATAVMMERVTASMGTLQLSACCGIRHRGVWCRDGGLYRE